MNALGFKLYVLIVTIIVWIAIVAPSIKFLGPQAEVTQELEEAGEVLLKEELKP